MENLSTLFDLVGRLASRQSRFLAAFYSALGLSYHEGRILTLIADGYCRRAPSPLFEAGLGKGAVGKAIQRLRRRGLLVCGDVSCFPDRLPLRLTEAGLEAVAEIRRLQGRLAGCFFGGMTEDDAAHIMMLANILD